METTVHRRRAFSWTWVALSWAALGIFYSVQNVIGMRDAGMHHAWTRLFIVLTLDWLPWALATPLVIALTRRFPPAWNSWRMWAAHASAIAVIDVVTSAWGAVLELWMQPWLPDFEAHQFVANWLGKITSDILPAIIVYSMIVAVTFALDSKARAAEQETNAARLNEQLSSAKLSALQRQIEPHFIFNSLNSIAGLVREQRNDAAVTMIVALSDFLRRVAASSSEPTTTLAQEADFLENYLKVQAARFDGRLRLEVAIPAELRDRKIPSLTLQPLVENAIKHGISRRTQGGLVRVTAASEDGKLFLRVYNDGPLLAQGGGDHGGGDGIGLANLRTRLGLLYGTRFELLLQNRGDSGVEATVILPVSA